MIYLDYASTTPIRQEVLQAYEKILKTYYANADSLHQAGRKVQSLLETSRANIAQLFHVQPREIMFTSCASEANNYALKGFALANQQRGRHIITSCAEHSSIMSSAAQLQEVFGFEVTYLPLHADGTVHLEEVKKALRKDTILVSIMCVNNETGCINDIRAIANYVHAHSRAMVHSDLVQAEAASLKTRFPKSGYSDDAWARLANLKLTLRAWAEEKQVSAIAAQCWRPMDTVAGVAPCFVFSELTGEGLPVICESDIHGAVSSVIAAAASRYQSATFLADLTIRHPTNDNAELLWHCGVFPHVLAKQEAANVALHFNRRNPAVGSWELKHGEITIVRFDGLGGAYSCLFGEGRGIDGPKTFGTYLWAEVANWPLWERKIMEGPYIHHCAGVYGHLAPAIWEACKYLPALKADPATPTAEQIQTYLL